MAVNEEASPICRGKNLSWETVMLFFNIMPKCPMPKEMFNSYIEEHITSWTQTHSQIARQLAFYYEEDGVCYPRFNEASTLEDLFGYMIHWAHNYFVPNPFTPSLRGNAPASIYSHLVKCIEKGVTQFDEALDSLFSIPLSSHDKIRVYLQNYSNIKFDQGIISLNEKLVENCVIIEPTEEAATNPKHYFLYFGKDNNIESGKVKKNTNRHTLQQIYYGAPGTGKSHAVKTETEAWEKRGRVVRTTFHPDSDYSTFVGAYKPTTESVQRYDIYNKPMTRDGVPVMEQIITYEFVEQAFLQAYIDAWKNREEPEFLVIEEINRGNCAQIFGDLFQLLDRGNDGYSEYAIRADKDLQKHLCKAFEDVEIADYPKVKTGKELLLPSNLYIRATMNTSDQSLFPIDSAFKRRWDWEYNPIKYKNTDWAIEIGDNKYSWASFQKEVNNRIFEATNSEDKMLGDYFVKPSNGIISERLLLNKILFYLWNDVCKDYDGDIFRTEDNRNVKFSDLYGENGTSMLISMMKHMGVSIMQEQEDSEEVENSVFDTEQTANPNTKYSVNDGPAFQKTYLAIEVFKEYIKLFSYLTPEQVLEKWKNKIIEWNKSKITIRKHLIEDQNGYDKYLDSSKSEEARKKNEGRLEPYTFKGKTFYLWKGWGDGEHDNITPFMKAVNESDWGITIKRI